MCKKLFYSIIVFAIILIVLNFLKSYTYEKFDNSFTIPDNIIDNYTGSYFTKNSKYNENNNKYYDLLKLDLSNNQIIVGKSIDETAFKNKTVKITNFIEPSTFTGSSDDYDFIIKLLDDNNITMDIKNQNSSDWISLNPDNVQYLKKIIQNNNNNIEYSTTFQENIDIEDLTYIDNIKNIFKEFKYNSTNNLKNISSYDNFGMLQNRSKIKVYYQYVFNFGDNNLDSTFNFKSIKNNIDNVHKNMKNKKYGLEVQIPFEEDLNTNNIKDSAQYINYINISIYYNNKLIGEDMKFINNKSSNITINYSDLLNTTLSILNHGKTFCQINSTKKKCGNITFPFTKLSKNEKYCLNNILPFVSNKCNNSVKLQPCIISYKDGSDNKNCYNKEYLYYNIVYINDQFNYTYTTHKGKKIKNTLQLYSTENFNQAEIVRKKKEKLAKKKSSKKKSSTTETINNKFKIFSAEKKYGPIKYGDSVYVYSVDKKKYNDGSNTYGPDTPLSFNQRKRKYKLYIYPYDVKNKDTYVESGIPFVLSNKKFIKSGDDWTSAFFRKNYYGYRVSQLGTDNIINFNHGKGTQYESVGSNVQQIIFN